MGEQNSYFWQIPRKSPYQLDFVHFTFRLHRNMSSAFAYSALHTAIIQNFSHHHIQLNNHKWVPIYLFIYFSSSTVSFTALALHLNEQLAFALGRYHWRGCGFVFPFFMRKISIAANLNKIIRINWIEAVGKSPLLQRFLVASVLVICYHRNKTKYVEYTVRAILWESNRKFEGMSAKSRATMFEFARIYICFGRSFLWIEWNPARSIWVKLPAPRFEWNFKSRKRT